MQQHTARATDLHRWCATPWRSRYDYATRDHHLSDMLNSWYFRNCKTLLEPGDRIHLIDRDDREAEVRVEYVDDELNEVGLSLVREVEFTPQTQTGYQIRHAGGHGRGSRYQILGPDGQIVMDNIAGKKTAERELEALTGREAA